MPDRSRWLVAVALVAVTGCVTATPPETPPATEQPIASPFATRSPPATLSSAPSPSERGQLEVEIGRLDPTVSGDFYQVVSDGTAIWYSASGDAETSGGTGSDLFHHVPGQPSPALVWENPSRDHSLVRLDGEDGVLAFADLDVTPGRREWNLWLIPELHAEPILIDSYPGGEEVPGAVPSFDVDEQRLAWTAFDESPDGPVSQLWLAAAPDWEPRLVASRLAIERELWFPSLGGSLLAYVELIDLDDRQLPERRIMIIDLDDPTAEPRRLDVSGRATMPQMIEDGVVWKETDPGMSMFTWGSLVRYSLTTDQLRPVSMGAQDFVNYPSAGNRFVAAWGSDASLLVVHDTTTTLGSRVERYPPAGPEVVDRPSLHGDLLVWVYSVLELGGGTSEIRWAWLPEPGSDRGGG